MTCHRCNGAMIYEKFYGQDEHFWGWKCIYCGEIFDQMILENRSELRGSIMVKGGRTRKARPVRR